MGGKIPYFPPYAENKGFGWCEIAELARLLNLATETKCCTKIASSLAHTVHHMVVGNFCKLLSGHSQTLVTIPTSDSVPYAVEVGKEFGGRQHLPVSFLLTQTVPNAASSPDDRSVLEKLRHGQGSMAGPSFPTSLALNLPNRVRQIKRNRKIINFREKI